MKNFEINKTIKIFSLINSQKKINFFCKEYRSILVVTNKKSVKKIQSKFFLNLKKKNFFFHIEDPGEPSSDKLDLSFHKLKKNSFDLVFAIGGGSIIDAAKILSCSLKQKKIPSTIIKKKKQSYYLPIITIPTVPGSSSEVNGSAVIKHGNIKIDVNGIFPKIAILDANLISNLEKKILFGGLSDAFSHLCEHYFNSKSHSDLVGEWTNGLFKGLISVHNKIKKKGSIKREVFQEIFLVTSLSPKILPVAAHGKSNWEIHPFAHYIGAFLNIPHRECIGFCLNAWFKAKRMSKKKLFIKFLKNVLDNNYKYIDIWHKKFLLDSKLPINLNYLKLKNEKKYIIKKKLIKINSCFNPKEMVKFLNNLGL